ncbi:MAG: VOC family protein [Candidatus Hydrogenedentes bacterium]|nr:VOC family protein [Candidatus Hydrogenedentota bacterium]
MVISLHHVHIFASDLEASLEFYKKCFGATVVLDAELAGARNVFLRIGNGRLHVYDQPPKYSGRGSIHHFGIQTDDLDSAVANLQTHGVKFRKPVADQGIWRYVMVPAPDNILIELFEVDATQLPEQFRDYFELPTNPVIPSC